MGEKAGGVLEGKKVALTCLERHDMLRNYHWANSRELITLTGMPPFPKSAADIERWFESGVDGGDCKLYAIKTLDGEYIGNIELRDIDMRHGKAEVGLLIGDPGARQKGYGSDAIRVLTRFAFDELRLHRLYARILGHNRAAQNTFARCGFKHEGSEREAHYGQGKFHDILIYGLLRSRFEKETPSETH